MGPPNVIDVNQQKAEERGINTEPNKRTRTSKVDVCPNAPARSSVSVEKDRESIRGPTSNSVQDEDRALPIVADGWKNAKMKRKRSVKKADAASSTSSVSSKSNDGYRGPKQGIYPRNLPDSMSRPTDTLGSRPGAASISAHSFTPKTEQESKNIKGVNKYQSCLVKYTAGGPTNVKLHAPARGPRSGSMVVANTASKNGGPVGPTDHKRTQLASSSSPPITQWADQRPQKISRTTRRTNIEIDADVMIEYEWRPHQCLTCKTFCHSTEMCPISVKEPLVKAVEVQDEGFSVELVIGLISGLIHTFGYTTIQAFTATSCCLILSSSVRLLLFSLMDICLQCAHIPGHLKPITYSYHETGNTILVYDDSWLINQSSDANVLQEPLVKAVEVQDEGFQVVKGRNKGKKQSEKSFLVRPKTNLAYKQVPKQRMQGSWKRKQVDITKTSNSFNVLTNESSSGANREFDGQTVGGIKKGIMDLQNESDDEDVKNGYDETTDDVARDKSNTKGSSTPIENGSNVINDNFLNICAILESHVDIGKLEHVCNKVFVKWKWALNNRFCTKGSHILIGWNDNVVDVVVLSCTSQAIHTQLVTEHWKMEVQGYSMFKLVKKMMFMKKPLRKLLQSQGYLHDRVVQLCHELDEVQMALDKDPSSITLREEEAVYLTAFTQAALDEERFLKQKSKIEWLQVGDTNFVFFHKSAKSRVSRSRIDCISRHDNAIYEGNLVPNIFFQHYMQFIANMICCVSDDEIQSVMFSIGNDKASGPDGYTSVFFKESWEVVGTDVFKAVRDFLSNGRRQLVIAVLSSMHLYWASVFILPAGIIHDIEQLMCSFLWCQGEMKSVKAKVS
ncbi:hypothetical protein Tco_0443142 [Tanacetum coccineum]